MSRRQNYNMYRRVGMNYYRPHNNRNMAMALQQKKPDLVKLTPQSQNFFAVNCSPFIDEDSLLPGSFGIPDPNNCELTLEHHTTHKQFFSPLTPPGS